MNIIFKDIQTNDVIATIDNVSASHMIYSNNQRLEIDHRSYIVDSISHRFTKVDSKIIHTRTTIKCNCLLG